MVVSSFALLLFLFLARATFLYIPLFCSIGGGKTNNVYYSSGILLEVAEHCCLM